MMVRQIAVLDADGYATCPDCGTRVKCGSAGLMNLEKCHQTSNACKNARDKRNKDQKKKNTSLFNSIAKHPVSGFFIRPNFTTTWFLTGSVCFLCNDDQDVADIGTSDCPRCSPTITLDLSQGQRVLEHVGTHILHDPSIDWSVPLTRVCRGKRISQPHRNSSSNKVARTMLCPTQPWQWVLSRKLFPLAPKMAQLLKKQVDQSVNRFQGGTYSIPWMGVYVERWLIPWSRCQMRLLSVKK